MDQLAAVNLVLGEILLAVGVISSVIMLLFALALLSQYGGTNVTWQPLLLLVPLLPGALFLWTGRLINRRSVLWPWVQVAALLALGGGLYLAWILIAGEG